MPDDACKLLVVDDEPSLRRALHRTLAAGGFIVFEARSGQEALETVETYRPDIVLLDINMPGIDGFEVCRRLRASSPGTGIIMVTVRDTEEDQVKALEAGADDYVTKPYRLRELTARVNSLRRRLQRPASEPQLMRAGAIELDVGNRLVRKNGSEIHLSPKEFELLTYFFQHQGGPILHTRLLHALWGPEYGGELEYLRSYVKMLRKKIEDDPAHPQYILTEPWVGYRFQDPSDPDAADGDS